MHQLEEGQGSASRVFGLILQHWCLQPVKLQLLLCPDPGEGHARGMQKIPTRTVVLGEARQVLAAGLTP